MVEILTKVFCGLFAGTAILFIFFALFVPAVSFGIELEKDEETKKKAQRKLTIQTVIFGSIVVILGVSAVVLEILSR